MGWFVSNKAVKREIYKVLLSLGCTVAHPDVVYQQQTDGYLRRNYFSHVYPCAILLKLLLPQLEIAWI